MCNAQPILAYQYLPVSDSDYPYESVRNYFGFPIDTYRIFLLGNLDSFSMMGTKQFAKTVQSQSGGATKGKRRD